MEDPSSLGFGCYAGDSFLTFDLCTDPSVPLLSWLQLLRPPPSTRLQKSETSEVTRDRPPSICLPFYWTKLSP